MKRTMVLGLAAGLVALFGVACGGDDTSEPETQPTTTTTTAPAEGETSVAVYFVHGEKIATAGRSVGTSDPERDALTALLEGPDAFDADIGMTSAIPEDTELRDLSIANGVATVDLSRSFESGGGSLSMQLRVAQVVFTLTQFDSVDTVTILLDGGTVEAIGGEGVPASDLTRDDFADVTPMILVESPIPGAQVASPLEVSGIANTFERTVRYEITDPEGLIVAEGFTTATGDTGTWGPFAFTAEFTTTRSGLGEVIVWQDDAASGARTDIYEVPVRMG